MPPILTDAKKAATMLRGLAVQQAPVTLTPRQYPWVILGVCTLMGLMVVPWITTFSPATPLQAALGALGNLSLSVAVQMSANYYLRYGNNPVRHWLDYLPLWLNALLRIGILLLVAALFGIGRSYLNHYLGIDSERPRLLNTLASSQIFAFIIIVLQIAIETLERSQHVAAENDQLKQEQLQARYEGLKQQLSPHFLFNSLTTLTGLIEEEPIAAKQFVEEMAEVYRYLLWYGERTAVSLCEEVTFLNSYCYVLQRRFGESLRLTIDLPAAIMDRLLPPLALQLLVENVVKHNALTRQRPMHIAIEFQSPDVLLVRNTLQPRLTPEPNSGTGLSNLTSRLRILHHRELLVEKSAEEFRVYVPLPA